MKFRITKGTVVVCPNCRDEVLVCVNQPLPGARVVDIVAACFRGINYPVYSSDKPVCERCKEGVYYKPELGFFTKKHGWSW